MDVVDEVGTFEVVGALLVELVELVESVVSRVLVELGVERLLGRLVDGLRVVVDDTDGLVV